jgi:hypothetical protein
MLKDITWQKNIVWVTVFSIAMGMLESAVVIYLRTIYYPFGFSFPLQPIEPNIALVEILREAATMIMLICIGAIAGKNFPQKFGYFIFSFAIWDIFYYVFLKLLINWPASFFTWDILFLIPLIWTSPVLCPVIVSFTMIILGVVLIIGSDKIENLDVGWKAWSLFISGSLVLIFTFMLDFIIFLQKSMSLNELFNTIKHNQIMMVSANYYPENFNWWLFMAGELLVLIGIVLLVLGLKRKIGKSIYTGAAQK